MTSTSRYGKSILGYQMTRLDDQHTVEMNKINEKYRNGESILSNQNGQDEWPVQK